MTDVTRVRIADMSLGAMAGAKGRVAVFADGDGKLGRPAKTADRLASGAVGRLASSKAFGKLKEGDAADLAWPAGMKAEALQVVRLGARASALDARKAGAAIGRARQGNDVAVYAAGQKQVRELLLGLLLRDYSFTAHKTKAEPSGGTVTLHCPDPAAGRAALRAVRPLAEGVFFARDLTGEPSNVLTTTEFAARLKGLAKLGVQVQVLDEKALARLGMRTLLAVGQGSASPSKVVVMQWKGGRREKPLALVGKGVVFDTGGISLKPSARMAEMTMDMGGAGVVAGVMKALALRKAKANVVGVVGLVENMPDGKAQRPGDVVVSMKGDTVEVTNTDAEGRLVLCDAMWYVQDRFKPAGMVDLATLTGAVIVGLGHERAGVFSNDDGFCDAFLAAAEAEGEGAWRLPLGENYDKLLKSGVADMRNEGGRTAGAITAAQFLKRFVGDGTPWIHLDIAGVALTPGATAMAPKGVTGWGVLALDRLVASKFER